jgi:hypothetical protein
MFIDLVNDFYSMMAMIVKALLQVVLCVAVGTGSKKMRVMLQYHCVSMYVDTSAITQAPLYAEQILSCAFLQALRVSTPP